MFDAQDANELRNGCLFRAEHVVRVVVNYFVPHPEMNNLVAAVEQKSLPPVSQVTAQPPGTTWPDAARHNAPAAACGTPVPAFPG